MGVALAGGGVFAALLVAEVAARVAGVEPHYGQILPLGEARVWTVDGVDMWNDRPRSSEEDIERAANAGRFTVVGLGDSIMYGRDLEPRYLDVMQRAIAERTGAPIEVLNLSVPGYNTLQEAVVFKEIEPRIKPDLVIVHFWGNDVRQFRVVGRYVVDYGDMSSDGRFVVRALPLPAALSDFLLLHSRLYDLLTDAIIDQRRRGVAEDMSVVTRPLADIDQRARRNGGRLLVLSSPECTGPTPRSVRFLPELRAFAAAHDVELIDITDWFRGRRSQEVSFDGVHFTAEGHRIVGEQLAAHLLGRDLKTIH